MKTLKLVYFEGCPNAKLAEQRLRGANIKFEKICQDSLPDDSPYKNYSSPTLLADHKIIFGSSTGTDGGCSIDLPDAAEIEERLRKIGDSEEG